LTEEPLVKIIHTADWHLCDRLGPKIDRTDDLKRRVEHIAELCITHAADVLLIAGDLFSEQASVEQMTASLTHMRTEFTPFFQRGGTVLAITGNHDRDGRINMVRAGMTLASPVAGQDGNLPGGRMYLLNGRALATLTCADGRRVQFVLVPYPFASRYDVSATEYRTKEEENKLLHAKIAEWVRAIADTPKFDKTLPTVLTAHLHVRGADLGEMSKYVLTERDDVLVDFADLNPGWAYVALGHIHKPQEVAGQANVRYPGSLDRLDFGETHDDHGVLLVEIDGAKAVSPIRLPIPATPFHTINLTDPLAELPLLAEKYPDRETAIVRVTVAPYTAGPSRDEVARELRRLFPRLHEVQWATAKGSADAEQPSAITPGLGFQPTVIDYLTRKLKESNDPDAAEVLELANMFLKVESES
jgi:DNA repair protein SbcD/Mre11